MNISYLYRLTADLIVLLHFFWIIFLIFGAFIGRRYRLVKFLHLGGIGFALFIQLSGWYCPLTYLEVWLRKMHDPSGGYQGSFIINYVQRLVYIELSADIIKIATIFLVFMSICIYLYNYKKN
jgi:hypothetical protein